MKHIILFENYISKEDKIVYHGSNKKIIEFDFDKIGTGYGMSYWGYGLYFAEDKESAIKYANWAVEKHGGDPYLYNINIKDLIFYVADHDDKIKLPKKEFNIILKKFKEIANPEVIKQVRETHPEWNWRDENDKRYKDYIYDGTNGDKIVDVYVEKLRRNFLSKEYSYSASTFYHEILPNYFKKIDNINYSKLVSDFLHSCGYDGLKFIDDVNKIGYVLFSSNKIKNLTGTLLK